MPELEGRLRSPKKNILKFPVNKYEFFLLPPLPEDAFVGYLTFEWNVTSEIQGSYHVYLVSKMLIAKAKRGELKFGLPAYSVRYETSNETDYRFAHAQICCDKKNTDYPGMISFLPRALIPKSLPHMPLRTCTTPAGFLMTLVAGLYGTESAAFKRLSIEEVFTDDELKLIKELRTGVPPDHSPAS